MSKPDDISKEAWDAAYDAFCDAVRDETKGREIIARAIMAATLAEREACACIADEMADELDRDNQILHSLVGRGLAAAIRKRGEA